MPPSFASKYQHWFDIDGRRNPKTEQELAAEYRGAWEQGGREDMYAVLQFIYFRDDSKGFDLVIEGLRNADSGVASEAAAIASGLIKRQKDLGPGLRDALEEFGRRFPEWEVIGRYALELLDESRS